VRQTIPERPRLLSNRRLISAALIAIRLFHHRLLCLRQTVRKQTVPHSVRSVVHAACVLMHTDEPAGSGHYVSATVMVLLLLRNAG